MSDLRDQILEAWHRLGNKTAVADELGVNRSTVYKHLNSAGLKDLAHGSVRQRRPNKLPLPKEGQVYRYLLTAAQNNTKVHSTFWKNLKAYAKFLDAHILISRFTYNKAAYGKNSVKPGTITPTDSDDAWFAHEILDYICDDPEKHGSCRWEMAPGLMFAAEMNISPTAVYPLSGLQTYTGRDSGIFPHTKISMDSIAGTKYEPSKFNFTTGVVTQRNYVAKKAGLKAEFHHSYGALVVEVNHLGQWWCRQISADEKGRFYDCPDYKNSKLCVQVSDGEVEDGHRAEAINWGDVHASELDEKLMHINWKEGGVIDKLQPKFQFIHDLLSFRSQSHHERNKFGRRFEKFVKGIDSVENEVHETALWMHYADRENTKMIVVNSNHDRHGERWLDDVDYRGDLQNAEFFLEAQLQRVRNIKAGDPFYFAEWALRRDGVPEGVQFLEPDESFVICKQYGDGIECGMHGDQGPNGSRGSTQSLTKIGRKINKGHDHTAAIKDGVYSAGACTTDFGYMSGPNSHSISHIVTYRNGKRAIITVWDGKWRG